MIHQNEDDQQSKVLYELCSMIIHTLKFPLPSPRYSTQHPYSSTSIASSSSSSSSKRQPWWTTTLSTSPKDSPAAFASLFFGICVALMLFGSVTFLIGLLLLPWITLLVLVFYVAAFVSNLSLLGRFIVGSFGVALAQACSR
ncbi:transmembrane protein, putative [Medicago truncatula]|nr:transmembrane protein, putative [Medicago truncatula]